MLELLLGDFIVIGHNVFHAVPNEVPILFVLGLLSIRLRNGEWAALGFKRPASWGRVVGPKSMGQHPGSRVHRHLWSNCDVLGMCLLIAISSGLISSGITGSSRGRCCRVAPARRDYVSFAKMALGATTAKGNTSGRWNLNGNQTKVTQTLTRLN